MRKIADGKLNFYFKILFMYNPFRRFFLIILISWSCNKSNHIINTIEPKHINIRDYGAIGNGISDDTHAFNLAMQKANSSHLPLYIPSGIYKASVLLSFDSLNIIGEKQPNQNLTDGTVILGYINCNNKKNISIINLGIDSRGKLGTQDAALSSGDGIDSVVLHQKFQNISLIGDGYMSYKHGILCQTGREITIKNIVISLFYHGIAIRSSNVVIDSVKAISCGFTSIVVKSAETFNAHTENVSINHVTITGNPNDSYSRGGLILVQSYENLSRTNNVHIQNVTSANGGVACIAVQQVKGVVEDVMINDCFSENQGDINLRACYDVDGGSNITFSNCTANNSLGFGFRSFGNVSNVRVVNSFEKKSQAGSWTGIFKYLKLNGIEIIK